MSKRVLITGGAGFIAHHAINEILRRTDWEVVSLDRLDYSGNLNRLHDILNDLPADQKKRVKIVYHDLKAELNPMIVADIGRIDYVVHMAAGSHVDRSITFPEEFVMDNVVGTCNILNYGRHLDSLEKFIYFSTDEVFGPAPNGIKYDEYARYNSTNPYSATKAGAEELAVAFENTYKMPMIISHTMNVFGERQHPEKFIPMCIKRARDGEVVTIHSDPSKTVAGSRHYIHAADVADAMMVLLENDVNQPINDNSGIRAQKYNIVGGEELSNLDLAKIIAEAQGKELKYEMVDFHSARPGHDLRYAMSGDRMKDLFGWEPVPVRDRIAEVVEWTLKNDRWLKA